LERPVGPGLKGGLAFRLGIFPINLAAGNLRIRIPIRAGVDGCDGAVEQFLVACEEGMAHETDLLQYERVERSITRPYTGFVARADELSKEDRKARQTTEQGVANARNAAALAAASPS